MSLSTFRLEEGGGALNVFEPSEPEEPKSASNPDSLDIPKISTRNATWNNVGFYPEQKPEPTELVPKLVR